MPDTTIRVVLSNAELVALARAKLSRQRNIKIEDWLAGVHYGCEDTQCNDGCDDEYGAISIPDQSAVSIRFHPLENAPPSEGRASRDVESVTVDVNEVLEAAESEAPVRSSTEGSVRLLSDDLRRSLGNSDRDRTNITSEEIQEGGEFEDEIPFDALMFTVQAQELFEQLTPPALLTQVVDSLATHENVNQSKYQRLVNALSDAVDEPELQTIVCAIAQSRRIENRPPLAEAMRHGYQNDEHSFADYSAAVDALTYWVVGEIGSSMYVNAMERVSEVVDEILNTGRGLMDTPQSAPILHARQAVIGMSCSFSFLNNRHYRGCVGDILRRERIQNTRFGIIDAMFIHLLRQQVLDRAPEFLPLVFPEVDSMGNTFSARVTQAQEQADRSIAVVLNVGGTRASLMDRQIHFFEGSFRIGDLLTAEYMDITDVISQLVLNRIRSHIAAGPMQTSLCAPLAPLEFERMVQSRQYHPSTYVMGRFGVSARYSDYISDCLSYASELRRNRDEVPAESAEDPDVPSQIHSEEEAVSALGNPDVVLDGVAFPQIRRGPQQAPRPFQQSSRRDRDVDTDNDSPVMA